MSTIVPQQLEGVQSPTPVEALWDRHRGKAKAFFWVLALCLAGYYGFRYYEQKQADKRWSAFAASVLIDGVYAPSEVDPYKVEGLSNRFLDKIRNSKVAELEATLASSDPVQRPYVLWLIANRAFEGKDWGRARSAAAELSKAFPDHVLCRDSEYPVQVRDEIKPDDQEKVRKPKTDYVAAVPGSMVSRLVSAIASAESFKEPTSFAKPEIPADAPRYKFKLSGENGEFTVALMTSQAPKHCEVFQRLASTGEHSFWAGIRVHEIQKPSDSAMSRFQNTDLQFQFGFESTRDEDRTKWDFSKPSAEENVVKEVTGLSNHQGAIAARNDDGKSQVDRLFVCGSDRADQDGWRQVFAYVVEGMDVVQRVCQSDFTRQEDEQRGVGQPAENITIESVTKVQ